MKVDQLATLYSDAGPFASVVVDVSRATESGEHEVELRARAVRDQLADAPDSVVDAVTSVLTSPTHAPAPVSRVVVATERGVLFDEVIGSPTEQPKGSWDALPDVGAWIVREGGAVPFVLALVDHKGGDVSTHRTDMSERVEVETVGGESQHVHKVPGGGWSHQRYQHTTENVWARNAEAVAGDVRRHVAEGYRLVIVAGDPKSRASMLGSLGSPHDIEIVELQSGGRADDGGAEELDRSIADVLTKHAVARRLELVHTLKDRLGRNYAVATGIGDVADAFVEGRVATLLIDLDESAELEVVLADHPGLALGAIAVDRPVRADRALVAAAALTGAEVVAGSRSTFAGTPVAALLRWDEPTY